MKSASNNHIKLLRKLQNRKQRQKEGLFLLEGFRAIKQVLENGKISVRNIFTDEAKNSEYNSEISDLITIESKLFAELSNTENSQGIIAICETPSETPLKEIENESDFIIAIDSIQDPGNLGTILRTAVWFGADALLVGKGSVDLFNPKVVRSTAGATGSIFYRNSELETELDFFSEKGWRILILDGNEGAASIESVHSDKKTVLVVGNEANGISDSLRNKNHKRILIPPAKKNRSVESLNAAIAISIAMYQLKG